MKYEYGIKFAKRPDVEPHRSGMTKSEAIEWVREWNEETGFPGTFFVIRREVGDWEYYGSAY